MPKLFLIRHAIAEDRQVFQKTDLNDDLRPLTEEGRTKMKKISQKLYRLCPQIDIFCQSPLLRSQQTTQILHKSYKDSQVVTVNSLAPDGDFEKLLQEISPWQHKNLALVGHEDHLSQMMFYFLTGLHSSPPFAFKKGGIACLEFTQLQKKNFRLLWLNTPKIWLA